MKQESKRDRRGQHSSVIGRHPTGEGSAQTQPTQGAYPMKAPVTGKTPGSETEGIYPAKAPKTVKAADAKDEEAMAMAAAKSKKVAGATDLKKLQETVDSLQKRIKELETTPLPRKYKVEKTYGPGEGTEPSEEETLKKEYDEVLGWVRSGKELTKEQDAKRNAVLAKMIHNKFGNDARKLM